MSLVKYGRLFLTQIAINYSAAMQYRLSFVMAILTSVVFELASVYLQVFLFTLYPQINGWTLQEHILLYAVVYGAIDGVFIIAYGVIDVSKTLMHGKLDTYLLYPIHPLFAILTSKIRVTSLGTWCVVFVLLNWSGIMTVGKLALYGVVTLLAAMVFASFMVIVQSLFFFMRMGEGFPRQMQLCFYSLSLAPPVHRGLLLLVSKTVIPTFFIAALPARIVQSFSWSDFGLLCAAAFGLSTFAVWFFNRGLRKYESG